MLQELKQVTGFVLMLKLCGPQSEVTCSPGQGEHCDVANSPAHTSQPLPAKNPIPPGFVSLSQSQKASVPSNLQAPRLEHTAAPPHPAPPSQVISQLSPKYPSAHPCTAPSSPTIFSQYSPLYFGNSVRVPSGFEQTHCSESYSEAHPKPRASTYSAWQLPRPAQTDSAHKPLKPVVFLKDVKEMSS